MAEILISEFIEYTRTFAISNYVPVDLCELGNQTLAAINTPFSVTDPPCPMLFNITPNLAGDGFSAGLRNLYFNFTDMNGNIVEVGPMNFIFRYSSSNCPPSVMQNLMAQVLVDVIANVQADINNGNQDLLNSETNGLLILNEISTIYWNSLSQSCIPSGGQLDLPVIKVANTWLFNYANPNWSNTIWTDADLVEPNCP